MKLTLKEFEIPQTKLNLLVGGKEYRATAGGSMEHQDNGKGFCSTSWGSDTATGYGVNYRAQLHDVSVDECVYDPSKETE